MVQMNISTMCRIKLRFDIRHHHKQLFPVMQGKLREFAQS